MELEFEIAQLFDEDIKRLPKKSREKITDQINSIATSLLNGRKEFNETASIPYFFNLKNGYESSMYLLRVDNNMRIVAAIDDDPIFDKTIITLYRLVEKDIAEDAYKKIGELLYKSYGML